MHKKTFIAISVLSAVLSIVIRGNSDFPCFYNAANSVLHGQSPYSGIGFYNPIWITVFFMPYALFPLAVATKLHIFASMFLYSLVVLKMAGNRKNSYLYALSGVFIILTSAIGNMEYIPLAGLLMPPQIGIWFVLTKPQMGIGVAAIMFLEMWGSRGLKYAALACVPASIALLASLALGMLSTTPVNSYWNASLLPYGLLAGIPLGIFAVYKRNRVAALGASVFCAPYIMTTGYVAFVFVVAELYIYLSTRTSPRIDNAAKVNSSRNKRVPVL